MATAEGQIVGARVRDEETGQELEVRAKRVVLCAGVWTDLVHELGGIRAGYKVRMSKGVHIVVPYEAIRADTGIISRTEKSVLFIIPWGQRWIVGTTDTDWTGDRAEPTPTGEDIDYILEHANRVLDRPLTRADVIGVYAGLRPLVAADDSKPTTKLSREHVVDTPVPGLTSIAGGKFTTYRLMARDVVDAAVADFGRWVPASVTDQLPLLGADGLAAAAAEAERLAEDYGVPADAVEHLLEPVRDADRGGPGADPGRPGAGPAAGRRPPVPGRGGRLRGHARGGAARGGRAGPPGPAVHRDRGARRRSGRPGDRHHG